jgi:hypothetical protein
MGRSYGLIIGDVDTNLVGRLVGWDDGLGDGLRDGE